MVRLKAASSLQELYASDLVDPNRNADSVEVFGCSNDIKYRTQLQMDLSIAEVIGCDSRIKKIHFFMHSARVEEAQTPAADVGRGQRKLAWHTVMDNAHSSSKGAE